MPAKDTSPREKRRQLILDDFMNSVSEALVIYDHDLNFIEVNEVARKQIGLPRSKILGMNMRDLIPGVEKTKRYKKYMEVIRSGTAFEEEVQDHPFAPGRYILIRAFKIEDGLGITTTDITSSKLALATEQQLKKDLEFLKDSATALIEMSNEDELFQYTADTLREICGGCSTIVNIRDRSNKNILVRAHSLSKEQFRIARSQLGNRILGMSFPTYKNEKLLKSGKLVHLKDGLYDISSGKIPKAVCSSIEKLTGIKALYTLGFTREEVLFGNVLIFETDENRSLNSSLIEAFIRQVSIAIERIRTERALHESETRYNIAFATSPDAVNVNRLSDGMYVDINEGFTKITGYTREEIIGYTSLEKDIWVRPEDRQFLAKTLLNKGFVRNMETEFRMKNGDILVGLMSAHLYKHDGVDHIISITRDITSRKRAEEELRISEERYRVVARQTGQIVYDYDIESGRISWVGAIEEVLGYTQEEFAGVNIEKKKKMVHPDDVKAAVDNLQKAIDEKSTYDMEYRLQHKDGSYVDIEEHGLFIPDRRGERYRMLGSLADITQRNKYQESLKLAWEKARESDRLKTAFLANISHEIRTPMNAILGFSDLLMNPNISTANRADYIDMINKSSHNLLNIINDIIDFSMIETGQMQLYTGEFMPLNMMKELHATFRQQLELLGKEHLDVKLDIPAADDKLILVSDEERIRQVMTNLIGNAIKYTDSGEIRIGYRIRSQGNNRAKIEFFVADTGIGIPPENRELIFERFRQLDDSNTRRYGGNGLGLSISTEIASLLGGEISLESEVGKGSVFYFTIQDIPVSVEDAGKAEEESEKVGYPWEDKRVLVAEDVISNYHLIESMLDCTGISIDWARNGEEVLKLYHEGTKYDLILMDIRMPVLNGYEATAKLRKSDSEIPIIALSANAMQSEIDMSIEKGCNDHISKPISQQVLLETMDKYL